MNGTKVAGLKAKNPANNTKYPANALFEPVIEAFSTRKPVFYPGNEAEISGFEPHEIFENFPGGERSHLHPVTGVEHLVGMQVSGNRMRDTVEVHLHQLDVFVIPAHSKVNAPNAAADP